MEQITVYAEIAAERLKQISKGFNPEHDAVEHGNGDLTRAAAYLATGVVRATTPVWATALDAKHTYREKLVIAAALLVAEIERLDRHQRIE